MLPYHTGHRQPQGVPCAAPYVHGHLQHQPVLSCTTNVSIGSHHPLLGGHSPEQDHDVASRAWLKQVGSWQSWSKQSWALAHPQGRLPLLSRRLPSSTAALREQPRDVTNTAAARSLPHPSAPGLCLLRPLHSPLGNSGSGTRFSLQVAAGDISSLQTSPVPAEGTVASHHFQLLISVLAGTAMGSSGSISSGSLAMAGWEPAKVWEARFPPPLVQGGKQHR